MPFVLLSGMATPVCQVTCLLPGHAECLESQHALHALAESAPFDVIHVGAAAPGLPAALIDQLCHGGHLVIPVGQVDAAQKLVIVSKDAEGAATLTEHCHVQFVPLTSRDEQARRALRGV